MWPIRHFNNYIPYVEKSKVLGVTFSSNITNKNNIFNQHINNKNTLARNAMTKLFRFRHLHPKILVQLFRIYILPIITFSVIPIIHTGIKGYKNVQIIQNKFLRYAHNIHWDEYITNEKLHTDLNINPISKSLYTTYNKHYTKLIHRHEDIFRWLLNDSSLEEKYFDPPPNIY